MYKIKRGGSMFRGFISKLFFALVLILVIFAPQVNAGGGDSFAGGMLGGTFGGIIGGSIANSGNRSSRRESSDSSREIDRLERAHQREQDALREQIKAQEKELAKLKKKMKKSDKSDGGLSEEDRRLLREIKEERMAQAQREDDDDK